MAVAYSARRLKAVSGTQTRLSLVQQRQRLRKEIAAFNDESPARLGFKSSDLVPEFSLNSSTLGAEWDGLPTDLNALAGEVDEGAEDSRDPSLPERLPLALPSTIGIAALQRHNLGKLADTERLLREGQLNDALQAIRTGIGYKSLLYRTKVRHAPTYRAKLRSFDDTHIADEGIRKHVRVYMHARQAMEKLFDVTNVADAGLRSRFLERYKEIKREDLLATTAVLESFTPGLRNKHTAWFWNIADTAVGADSAWMKDCEQQSALRTVLTSKFMSRSADAVAESLRK